MAAATIAHGTAGICQCACAAAAGAQAVTQLLMTMLIRWRSGHYLAYYWMTECKAPVDYWLALPIAAVPHHTVILVNVAKFPFR